MDLRPLLAALAAAMLFAPAHAAQIASYKVATWDVGVYTNDQSGRFSHCAAAARYQSGITLLFSVSESLEWAIGFSSPEWNLREGRNFDVQFRIDGGAVTTVSGRAVNNRLVRATLPDSAALFNQFRYGYRMVVSINDNPDVAFNLNNTNAMLTDILNCARKYKGHVERTNDRPRGDDRDVKPRNDDRSPRPRIDERDTGRRGDNRTPTPQRNDGIGSSGGFSNIPGDNRVARVPDQDRDNDTPPARQPVAPPANTPVLGPTPDSRAEATEIATDILRRANFTFEFQKPEQLSGELRDKYDVVWRADGILGTLRILAGPRAATVEKIRSDVIASDATTCKGKFASGALPAMSGSQSVTIFTSCESDRNWSTYYIAVPRRKGGSYLLGIAGTGEAAARLQNVANAYRTVALEVLEK